MANKKETLGIFRRTEPAPAPGNEPPADDPVKPIGVGLRNSEGKHLTEIAQELGVNRHSLLVWIVREFMRRYDAGERPETENRRVLKK